MNPALPTLQHLSCYPIMVHTGFKLARTEPLNKEAVPHTKKPQGAQGGELDGLNKIKNGF